MRPDAAEGEATACRWRTDAEADPSVRRGSVGNGAEVGCVAFEVPFAEDVISPAAAETLLVNEEMAQPAQEAASLG